MEKYIPGMKGLSRGRGLIRGLDLGGRPPENKWKSLLIDRLTSLS